MKKNLLLIFICVSFKKSEDPDFLPQSNLKTKANDWRTIKPSDFLVFSKSKS